MSYNWLVHLLLELFEHVFTLLVLQSSVLSLDIRNRQTMMQKYHKKYTVR